MNDILSMQSKYSDTLRAKGGIVKQRGICIDCGEPTGRHHTANYCFPCAKKHDLEYYAKRNQRARDAKSN